MCGLTVRRWSCNGTGVLRSTASTHRRLRRKYGESSTTNSASAGSRDAISSSSVKNVAGTDATNSELPTQLTFQPSPAGSQNHHAARRERTTRRHTRPLDRPRNKAGPGRLRRRLRTVTPPHRKVRDRRRLVAAWRSDPTLYYAT